MVPRNQSRCHNTVELTDFGIMSRFLLIGHQAEKILTENILMYILLT